MVGLPLLLAGGIVRGLASTVLALVLYQCCCGTVRLSSSQAESADGMATPELNSSNFPDSLRARAVATAERCACCRKWIARAAPCVNALAMNSGRNASKLRTSPVDTVARPVVIS